MQQRVNLDTKYYIHQRTKQKPNQTKTLER
jgi:hypothetical protein